MKRQNKIPETALPNKGGAYHWPTIFCVRENTPIAVGVRPVMYVQNMGLKKFEPVSKAHFNGAVWRNVAHIIDFSKCKVGEKVLCPHCGGPVDFRIFISDDMPKFA